MTPNGPSHDADALREHETSTLPSITITDATPQRTSVAQTLAGLSTPTSNPALDAQTPASSGSGKGTDLFYRLLYRGALSLPDSYLQLDGLAFSARLPNRQASSLQDSPSCSLSQPESFARELMYNPLALALESMRGRQSLRFKGTVRLQDVWIDDSGDVYMDIHPFATLTRVYFENILCLSPLVTSQDDTYGPKRTEFGVRVSLGDTDGPETTDIIIYGETSTLLHPPPLQLSCTSVGPPPLTVRVARITPAPRAPRPDDPTPRHPPAHLLGTTTFGDLGANKRILARPTKGQDKGQTKRKEKAEDQMLHRARDVMLHLPRSGAPTNGNQIMRGNTSEEKDAVFKVPELPAKARKQGDPGTDVFGTVQPPRPRSIDGKGKDKLAAADREDSKIANSIECENRLVLKKLAAHRLTEAGIPRSHSEFKDVYGFVYRGAAFALRSQMKTFHISAQAAEAVIDTHVKLYALTTGDVSDASRLRPKTLSENMDVDCA